MEEDPLSALALSRVPGIGPHAWHRLMQAFGDPATALGAGRSALLSLGLAPSTVDRIHSPDWAAARNDAAWVEAHPERHLLRLGTPAYPPQLAEIPDAPPLLFAVGRTEALHQPQVALVGSRHASPSGKDLAHDLARALAREGLGVTSGLARGIDAAAHRGALAADGTTHAVIATGPDQVYPANHQRLHREITSRGAVVGEQPPGTAPQAGLFPRRNRIISGVSLGVVVIQAGPRSGALTTARHAAEQGREVFAVPGSIHEPMARGCHHLLRQGAKLVECVSDILEELPQPLRCFESAAAPDSPGAGEAVDAEEERVLQALGYDPVTLDTIQQRSGLTLDRLSSILLAMELKGLLTAVPGGRYQRRKPEG